MDNSDCSRNEHLGVNKIGKNIRKSPLHQPSFANPQVYNINKNDFRDVVQRLTGSPSRLEPLLTHPPQNQNPPPRPASMRLQRIRPPSLAPIDVNRPRGVVPRPTQFGQPPPQGMVPPPMVAGDHTGWAKPAESPISAYMRYLQNSIVYSNQGHPQPHLSPYPHLQTQSQPSPPPSAAAGLLPHPHIRHLPSPRTNGFPPLLPSPSNYLNLLSPRSPYPFPSPEYHHLPPRFPFSPMAQSGILGPGPPQPPPSPGFGFPPSPGFFQILSPRWRD